MRDLNSCTPGPAPSGVESHLEVSVSEMNPPSGSTPVPVEVVIGGRSYRLRGSDPEQLRRLASEVDQTLRDISGPGGPSDDFKTAVLAALNLAAERDEQRRDWREQLADLRERSDVLEERLEKLASLLGED